MESKEFGNKTKKILNKMKKNFNVKPLVTSCGSPTAIREMYGKKKRK